MIGRGTCPRSKRASPLHHPDFQSRHLLRAPPPDDGDTLPTDLYGKGQKRGTCKDGIWSPWKLRTLGHVLCICRADPYDLDDNQRCIRRPSVQREVVYYFGPSMASAAGLSKNPGQLMTTMKGRLLHPANSSSGVLSQVAAHAPCAVLFPLRMTA